MLRYEDLEPLERRAIDRSQRLSRDAILALMNDFDIPREHMFQLITDLHAGSLGEQVYLAQAERAHRDRDAFAVALAAARGMSPHRRFHLAGDGTAARTVAELIAMLAALHAEAATLAESADRVLAQRKERRKRAPALKVPRDELMSTLLEFWTDVLGRKVTFWFDDHHNEAGGETVFFLAAATAGRVPAKQYTPTAIHGYLKRLKAKT